ncbi:MAG: radical SAM protein [Candidatus Alcyoniella australis]|nr:radical SAM protein [Candidatus Alcyoniella australis]
MQRKSEVIFGPVPSRRLGMSLGVDVVPWKVCSYDCVYCEVGRTTEHTRQRAEYAPLATIEAELRKYFSDPAAGKGLDYVTFSGSGEPTLNSGIGRLIRLVKQLCDVPVAVLTNGSLLDEQSVRDELFAADLVVPSLDAVSQEVFQRVNRPAPGIDAQRVVQGIELFTHSFAGEVWLEILFVKGINDSSDEVERLAQAAAAIAPFKIQLTTVVRPPGFGSAAAVDSDWLRSISARFAGNVEVVADFSRAAHPAYSEDRAEQIIKMLRIRPVTIDDLCASLGLHPNEVRKYLDELQRTHGVESNEFEGRLYYTIDKRKHDEHG